MKGAGEKRPARATAPVQLELDAERLALDAGRRSLAELAPGLRLGTSSYSSPDWCGPFYPPGLRSEQFLAHYATRFDTVEIDATWHAMPSRRTVQAWHDRVPDGFLFSAKVPKVITHELYLQDCGDEWNRFVSLMELLREKRGPLLFQFPYVAKGRDAEEYRHGADFRRRLERFLPQLPSGWHFVVEVRNRGWVDEALVELLRRRGVALALTAYPTMPAAAEIMRRIDPVSADFAYLRFLGDHRSMDNLVARARESGTRDRDWSEVIVDRADEMRAWIDPVGELLRRVPQVLVYFNNHYAGYAPGSLERFAELWREAHPEETAPAGPVPSP